MSNKWCSGNTHGKAWTVEEDLLLRKMHKEGLSFSLMANYLPGRTRNACIGFARRAGLANDKTKPHVDKLQKATAKKVAATLDATLAKMTPFSEGGCTLMQLQKHQCRWPVGDWKEITTLYCGQPAVGSYCEKHHKMGTLPRRVL